MVRVNVLWSQQENRVKSTFSGGIKRAAVNDLLQVASWRMPWTVRNGPRWLRKTVGSMARRGFVTQWEEQKVLRVDWGCAAGLREWRLHEALWFFQLLLMQATLQKGIDRHWPQCLTGGGQGEKHS